MKTYQLTAFASAPKVLSLAAFIFVSASWAAHAQPQEADLATKWKVDDENPRASIPPLEARNQDPLEFAYFLQDLAARGESAFEKGAWADAIKYYNAMAFAVPDAGVSYRRMCLAYGKLGKFAHASGSCGKAITLPMAQVLDHMRFIEYTLKSELFTPRDVSNIDASLAHLRQHAAAHPQPAPAKVAPLRAEALPEGEIPKPQRSREELIAAIKEKHEKRVQAALDGTGAEHAAPAPVIHLPTEIGFLACKVGVKLRDAARVSACLEELRGLKVDETYLVGFSWSRALFAKDAEQAEKLLTKAQSLGIPEATMAAMKAQHAAAFEKRGHLSLWLASACAALALAAALHLLRQRRQAQVSHG